ncbi:MAG: hypothetical protein ACI8XB_002615 [Patiriisocius sp.]|jgi:hypothetical protein
MKNIKENYLKQENKPPLWVLHSDFRNLAENAVKALQCSEGYVLTSILVVLSTCIGNSHRIVMRENYTLFCNIYAILIGKPGTKKTVVLSLMFKVLLDAQHQLSKRYNKFSQYDDSEKEPHLNEEGVYKKIRQLIISDATIEGISDSLNSGGYFGLCYFQDEFAGFVKSMNKYSNGGGDMEFFLSIWSNTVNAILRKTSDPVLVRYPTLSMIGGLQPDVAYETLKLPDNGYPDRNIYVIEDKMKFTYSKKGVNSDLYDAYATAVLRILKKNSDYVADNQDCPKDVPLSPEATLFFDEWCEEHYAELNTDELSDKQKGAWVKLESYLGRTSLIMELSDPKYINQECSSISLASIKKAAALVHYFKGQVLKLHQSLDSKSLDDTMNRVLVWMISKAKSSGKNEFYEFSVREIYSNKVAGLSKFDETDEIVEQLHKRRDVRISQREFQPGKKKTVINLSIKHFKN